MKERIYMASPTMHGEEQKFVQEAFDTNWIAPLGKNVNEFEKELAAYVGAKDAAALSAGSAALHLALKAAGVKAGDIVFCQDLTFSATANPIIYEDAVPVFIDSDYETWNMSPEALERAFEKYPDVKAVMPVHLYGLPANMDRIMEICKKHGVPVIEDAAESLGTLYHGQYTGTFGDYGILSFNGNKIITGSSGGMFLTDDAAAADKVRKWSTQARENVPWYQHEELGYNYRMSNVIAGVVRGQLPYLEEHISQKKAIYMRYKKGFKNLPVKMNPFDAVNSQPNYWLSCLLIDSEAMCKQVCSEKETFYLSEKGKTCPTEILEALAAMNAEGRPIWKPMHMQPLYRMNAFVTRAGSDRAKATYCINGAEAVPNGNTADVAMDIFERGVCLPSDIKMTTQEQDRIIEIIKSCFE